MDIVKAKAAIEAARLKRSVEAVEAAEAAVKSVFDASIAAGQKGQHREFNGLSSLGKANTSLDKVKKLIVKKPKDRITDLLDKANAHLDTAVERTKEKEAKAPKAPKADKKKDTTKK